MSVPFWKIFLHVLKDLTVCNTEINTSDSDTLFFIHQQYT